ncbi:MarR family winged helix-turn-helix transcriptional regulator [Salinifilum ghardaiensis]
MAERKGPLRLEDFDKLLAQSDLAGAGHIPLRLRLVSQIYARVADDLLRSAGTSLAAFTVLASLQLHPGASGAALADLTAQTPQGISAMAASLERDGLLERRSTDGRRLSHHLTSRGEEVVEQCRDLLTGLHERAFAEFDEDRVARMVEDLRSFAEGLLRERG